MNWLRAWACRTTLCHVDGDSEGWELGIEWLGFTVELTIARRVRSFDDADEAGA